MGIHEMKGALLQEDIDSWQPLVDWLDGRPRPAPQFELVPPPSGAEEGDDPLSAAFSGT
jgi:hypothetical protein